MEKFGLDILLKQLSASPALLTYLEANFKEADAELIEHLLTQADESAFPLRQWVEALRLLGHWLDARGLFLSIEDKVGYVSCAAEAASASAPLTHLPLQVEEMLETYGCERAVQKEVD